MAGNIPLINGIVRSWADVKVNIAGATITGITAVKYDDEQTIENVYGAGIEPVGRGRGQIKYSGSLTLLLDEVAGLIKQSKTGRLQGLGIFDVVVSFLNDETGLIETHVLKYCEFQKTSVSTKSGDTKIEIELPLVVGKIIWK